MTNKTEKEITEETAPDPVQDALGTLGRWQIIISFVLSLVNFPAAWRQLSLNFLAPPVNFTCVSPIPMDLNVSMVNQCTVRISENVTEVCTNFTYDRSVFHNTIVFEWDLVCGKQTLVSVVQTSTMVGILVGNMVFGILADRIGRKIPLMIAIISQSILGITSAFMPNYPLFLTCIFLSSIATGGTMLISYVIIMEIVGTAWRARIAVLFHIPFILGYAISPLLSYLTRTWNGYLLAVSIPPSLLLSYFWLVPESPRWLLAVGRIEETREVLRKGARLNEIGVEKVDLAIESYKSQLNKECDRKVQKKYSLLDLFRTPNLRKRTIAIVINWFTCGLYYLGVIQYVGHFGGNIFINIAIAALLELPGLILGYFLVSRVSRLKIVFTSNVLAGVCLLLVIVSPTIAQVSLAAIGLSCMALCFDTMYLYSGEVFPTVVRNAGFGLCSVVSKIGSMIAPFIIEFAGIGFWLPSIIFATGPLISAALCLFLPETMNCKLPETIEDGENFKSKKI